MKNNKAFTLVELLVVISIIGVISSIVFVSFSGSRDKARLAKAQNFDAQISHALGAYAVGIWRFEEGGGGTAYDESGYGNDGTIQGAVPAPDGGVYAGTKALYFDGSYDRLNISSSALRLTNNTTLCLWMKLDTDIGSGAHRYYPGIFSVGSGGGWNDFITFRSSGGNRITYEDASGSSRTSSSFSYTTGDWIHVVISMDSNRAPTFYINGKSKGTGSASNYISLNYLGMGYAGATNDGSSHGSIDDVRIYNESLSSAQIQQHFVAGAPAHGIAVKQ
jgi:prepilin-type N-terminal cleavage/methylation domain-containing protein